MRRRVGVRQRAVGAGETLCKDGGQVRCESRDARWFVSSDTGTLIPTDAGQLNWGMIIIETPDESLTRDDEDFQAWCGAILSSILENEHLQSKKKMI